MQRLWYRAACLNEKKRSYEPRRRGAEYTSTLHDPQDVDSETTGGVAAARAAAGPMPESARRLERRLFIAPLMFMSTGLAVGTSSYLFGAFVAPLEAEFGWSRAELNVAVSLAFLSGLAAPIVGRLLDRFGARPVIFASLLLIATGFGLRPLIHSLWQFYLFSGIAYLGMPGATVLAAGRVVGLWYPKIRGRMMGWITAGNNFGGIVVVPIATAIIASAGWRWSYEVFGLAAAALAVTIVLVIRDRPEAATERGTSAPRAASQADEGFTARAAFRTPTFYFITFGITAGAFTYSVILTQLIPHLEDVGFSESLAGAALSVMAGFGLASKLLFGRVSENVTARVAFLVSLLVQATGLALFIVTGGSGAVWLAVVVFGLGYGGMGALVPLSILEAFGVRAFGTIMGLVSFVGIVPQLVGPIVAGVTFDATNSYTTIFAVIVALHIAGAVSFALARPARAAATAP